MIEDLAPQLSDLVPLLPGAATGVVTLGVSAWVRQPAWRGSVAAVGVAAAVFVTWMQVHGAPAMPPSQSSERALWSVAAWAFVLAIASRFERRGMLVIFGGALAATGLTLWLVGPLLGREPDDPSGFSLGYGASLGAGFGVVAVLAGMAAPRVLAFAVPTVLAITAGAIGQVMFLFGAASLAQLCGAVAMACGGAAALTFGRRPLPMAGAACAFGAVGLFAIDGHAFLDSPPPAAVLLMLGFAPLLPWLGALQRVRDMRPFVQLALIVGASAIVAGAAVGIAFAEMPEPDPYADAYK